MRLILSAIALLIALPTLAQAEAKFAYVDLQRAIMETKDGKKAKGELEAMKKQRQSQLDVEQKKLREEGKNLEAQKAIMLPAKYAEREREFAMKIQKLRQTHMQLQQQLQQKEAQLTQGILARMGMILAKLGRERSYSVILEKTESRILWAPQSLDLTNELIARYNAGEGKKGKGGKKSRK